MAGQYRSFGFSLNPPPSSSLRLSLRRSCLRYLTSTLETDIPTEKFPPDGERRASTTSWITRREIFYFRVKKYPFLQDGYVREGGRGEAGEFRPEGLSGSSEQEPRDRRRLYYLAYARGRYFYKVVTRSNVRREETLEFCEQLISLGFKNWHEKFGNQ